MDEKFTGMLNVSFVENRETNGNATVCPVIFLVDI